MAYLLDTHVLIWWYENPQNLSKECQEIIKNGENIIFVSSVSTWEIIIKKSLGKLTIPDSIFDLIIEDFSELPISIHHTQTLEKLANLHKDPFDRLLIAQAQSENLKVITRDEIFAKYKIPIIKA